MKTFIKLIFIQLLLCNCQHQPQQTTISKADSKVVAEVAYINKAELSAIEKQLETLGFINIVEADSTILVDLAYTRPENFTGEILYKTLHNAYLHPLAMESLLKANQLLKANYPNYRLLVLDAARPMSVQKQMWDKVKGTPRNIYVSNPNKGGGMHNYGMAVDLTIVDENGNWLSMGTPFDYFGIEAHITNEAELVKEGKITNEELRNRVLLRSIMKEAGFLPLYNEWWHFNRLSREETIANYKLIE